MANQMYSGNCNNNQRILPASLLQEESIYYTLLYKSE